MTTSNFIAALKSSVYRCTTVKICSVYAKATGSAADEKQSGRSAKLGN